MRRTLIALVVLATMAMSCTTTATSNENSTTTQTTATPPTVSDAPTTTAPLSIGSQATARWRDRKLPDYVFVVNRGCTSCDQRLVGSFRITVRDGVVAMVEQMPTREVMSLEGAPTIDSLLAEAADYLDGHPESQTRFDPDLGIPLQAELGVEDSFTIDFFSFDLEAQRQALAAARALWKIQTIDDYVMTWQYRCFCDPIGPFETSVVDGSPVESRWLDDPQREGEAGSETVASLFATIERYLAMHPVQLEVSYDDALGFPTEMYADVDLMLADEEFGFVVRTLTPASG